MSQQQEYVEVDSGNQNQFVVLTQSDLVTEAMLLAGATDSPVGMSDEITNMMQQQQETSQQSAHPEEHPLLDEASMEMLKQQPNMDSEPHHQLVTMAEEVVDSGGATELDCLEAMELQEFTQPPPPPKEPQKCLICDQGPDATSTFYDIQSLYVTNGYKFLMFDKLQQVLSINLSRMRLQSYQLCRRCFSLVEDVHSMEIKIGTIKEGLSQQFNTTVERYGIQVLAENEEPQPSPSNPEPMLKTPRRTRRKKPETPPSTPPILATLLDPPSFSCPKCKKQFRKVDFKLYVHHVKTECGMSKSVVCSDCGKVFRNRTSLLAHRRNQHKVAGKKAPKSEPDSEQEEEEEEEADIEMVAAVSKEKTSEDSVAGRVGRRATARRRTQRKASVSSADDVSDASVKEEEQSDDDADTTAPVPVVEDAPEVKEEVVPESSEKGSPSKDVAKTFHCKTCDISFATRGRYSYHWRTRHVSTTNGDGDEDTGVVAVTATPSKCTKCDKPVGADPGRHVCKWYVCEVCKLQLCTKGQLRQHLLTHSSYRPFQCPQCVKTFTRKEYLTIHLRVHNDERPYSCDFCAKAFRSKTHLNNHRRLHTGEKPYICQHCGQAFPVPQNLHSHLQTHRGSKPVQCDLCNRAFRDMSHLKKHYRVHTGEKPYQCTICGRVFASRSNCQAHERTHTKDIKQWQCTVCNKGFPRKTKLREHMAVHGQQQDPSAATMVSAVPQYKAGDMQEYAATSAAMHVQQRMMDIQQYQQGDPKKPVQQHDGTYTNEEVIVVQVFSYPDQNEDVSTLVSDV